MNLIFHDMIGKTMGVNIDYVMITSEDFERHMANPKTALQRMWVHRLKMNPLKCVLRVDIGNFLGFLVHKKDIKIYKNKARAIIEVSSPKN